MEETLTIIARAPLQHRGERGAAEPDDRRHHRVDLRLGNVGVELHEGHVGLVAGVVDEHRDVARARALLHLRDAVAVSKDRRR